MAELQETIVRFDVPPGYGAGERVDVYVAGKMENASRAKIQRGIKEGRLSVNGEVVTRPSQVVQAGDVIECLLLRPPPTEVMPEDIPLSIVYEDDHLLVVDKPAGMVVHPAYGHRSGTLVNALLHHVNAGPIDFEEIEDQEDEDVGLAMRTAGPRYDGDPTVRPGLVHRLDKDTSGLIAIAKSDTVHAALAEQFTRRTIRRRYIALVWGIPEPPEGTVETFLGRDTKDRRRIAVVPEARGKHAITHYAVEENFAHAALVSYRLETGRTHQIRVHSRHLGHPIVGDVTYDGARIRRGPETRNRGQFFANLFEAMPRQALHARSLGFRHPVTGAELDFESPVPEDMAFVIARIRAVEPA